MRRLFVLLAVAVCAFPLLADPPKHLEVIPGEFDPAHSDLVNAAWLSGTGCPTAVQFLNAYTSMNESYTDPACLTGDPKDKSNEGLLLFKTGPTANNAAAIAEVRGVNGTVVTELGYDIRKIAPAFVTNPAGSHCGAGAPRFNVVTDAGTLFIGCSSPPATSETPGVGWTRLRWTIPPTAVRRIFIVFDEGQDTGADFFGGAVLDNIFVNGASVGRGPTDAH